MKQFLYICLLLMLAISACMCRNRANDQKEILTNNPPIKDPTNKNKSVILLICTANVQFFKTNTPQAILNELATLRQEQDDIVIFGLQETAEAHFKQIENMLPGYTTYDHRLGDRGLSNMVLIYNKSSHKVNFSGINLPRYGRTPQRYATIIEIPDLNFKLANTHLFGGRFDDRQFFYFPKARVEQMAVILDRYPTVVMGDFNVDNNQYSELSGYWERLLNDFIQNNPNADEQKAIRDYKEYKNRIHAELSQRGYISLFDRETMPPTSMGNTVTDWIYADKKLQYTILDKGMIMAINRNLSDHNFLWVRIKINY